MATTAKLPAAATTTSPIRSTMRASTGPNHPSLIASSLGSTHARSPSTSRQVANTIGGGTGPRVKMSGPRLAAEQRQPGPELRHLIHVEPVVRADVHHAVVSRHVQAGLRGQPARELLGQLVHVGQLVVPGIGADPEHMPGTVQVAVVDRHQRTRVLREGGRALRGQGTHAVGRPEFRAAQRRDRQASSAERAPGHMDGRDAGRGGPFIDRGQRLPLARIDPRVPAQRVEQQIRARHPDLVAEHPVLARRAPGTQRGEARGRRGREPGRDRLGVAGQLGQERRGSGMTPEQFPAEPVHDQQARTLGGGQVEDVLLGRGFGLEGREDRRRQIGQGRGPIGRHGRRMSRLGRHAGILICYSWVPLRVFSAPSLRIAPP